MLAARYGMIVRCVLSAAIGGFVALGSASAEEPAKAAKKSIYDAKADARVEVEKAVAAAKKADKRVLLMFGGDWCGWCHKLHGLFGSDREIAATLSNEYQLVMIDTEAPNAREYFKAASEGQQHVGYPFLAVYDAEGKLLVGQQTDVLEEGDHHDPAKVKEFLDKWKAPQPDAEGLLKAALSKAASENKRLFLAFGAPWCGWCHRLEEFLAAPEVASAIADDLLVLKIDVDRMPHGREVMLRYRKGEEGGIPWYVVLDGENQPHGTADAPGIGNIGYPASPEEITAFMKLLESQGSMDPAQLDVVRKGLDAAAEKINAGRAAATQKAR